MTIGHFVAMRCGLRYPSGATPAHSPISTIVRSGTWPGQTTRNPRRACRSYSPADTLLQHESHPHGLEDAAQEIPFARDQQNSSPNGCLPPPPLTNLTKVSKEL